MFDMYNSNRFLLYLILFLSIPSTIMFLIKLVEISRNNLNLVIIFFYFRNNLYIIYYFEPKILFILFIK